MGMGCSLSYVPIFAELIDTTKNKYIDWMGELNNSVSGILNFFHFSAFLGEILGGYSVKLFGFVGTCEIFAVVAITYSLIYRHYHLLD